MAETNYRGALKPKDITAIHKVRYDDPKTIEEFNEVYKHLHTENRVYYSNVAERRRTFNLVNYFKLPKYWSDDKQRGMFERIVSSFMYNINKELTYEEIISKPYLTDKHGRVYMIDFQYRLYKDIKDNEIELPYMFTLTFIDKDVVYWEKFTYQPVTSWLNNFSKSNSRSMNKIKSFKIKYEKSVKAPFVMEPYNLQTKMAKKLLKKNFNITSNQIMKGMLA